MQMSKLQSHKVTVVGASGVGKTELLHRIARGTFNGGLGSTIASAFSVLPRRTMQGRTVGIWDTAGAERMSHFLPVYVRNSDLVLLCFRMDDDESIEWLERLLRSDSIALPQCLVVATQSDRVLDDEHRTKRYDTSLVARHRLGLAQSVYVTSSLEGHGIGELVEAIYAFLETPAKQRSTGDLPDVTIDDASLRSRVRKSCCSF